MPVRGIRRRWEVRTQIGGRLPSPLLLSRRKPLYNSLVERYSYLEIYIRSLYTVEEPSSSDHVLLQQFPSSILANLVVDLGLLERPSPSVAFGWSPHCCSPRRSLTARHSFPLWYLPCNLPRKGKYRHNHQPPFANSSPVYRHKYDNRCAGPHWQRSLGVGFERTCGLAAHGKGDGEWCFC